MVYLEGDCVGGGTHFPQLRMPRANVDKWCRFVECGDEQGAKGGGDNSNASSPHPEGMTFKPIKGNAIYWENLRPDGSGYPETWHAAFPVTSGTKVGLNIWSWYQPPRWSPERRWK